MEHGRNDAAAPADQAGDRQGTLGALFAVGRLVGFLVFAGAGLGAIAALVLLGPYTEMQQARYELGCAQASLADMQALKTVNDRLLAEGPQSETVTKRLMLTQTSEAPKDERIIETSAATPLPPGLVQPARHPRPDPPDGVLWRWAARVQDPSTRRGVFLLAIGALVTAMFLFAPPNRYRARSAPEQADGSP